MNPDARMAISLVFSLAVSAQNFWMAALGKADIVDVGLRYAAAFVFAFLLVGFFGGLITTYIVQHEERRAAEADDAADEPSPAPHNRRTEDSEAAR